MSQLSVFGRARAISRLGGSLSACLVRLAAAMWKEVTVAEDDWALLQADIPRVLSPNRDDDGEVVRPQLGETVQLRDTGSGQRILFCPDGKGVGVTVSVPDDHEAATQLRMVLQAQRTASLSLVRDHETGGMRPMEHAVWEPLPDAAQAADNDGQIGGQGESPAELAHEWRTGWRHNATYRDEIAAAIVAVLRDGLGSAPSHLRVCAFNDDGPADRPRLGTAVPDRPTTRGVPARCSGWDDFTDRLGWVLTTLPRQGYLDLPIPGTQLSIQLSKGSKGDQLDSRLWNEKGASPGPAALHDPLLELGWRWGTPGYLIDHPDNRRWMGPKTGTGTANPTVHSLAAQTVATLRTVGGATDPNSLEFRAFEYRPDVQELPYVATELGSPQT
ncbi:hypothetical protein [Nocardia sp. NPDC056100]|uniref:TY-Chap domain-containing protein n=1 Tax=Nocardia sp. NPDC056100 TaxID=3345712 RepID=UPI0035D6B95B